MVGLRLGARVAGTAAAPLERISDLVLGRGGQIYVFSRGGEGLTVLQGEGLELRQQALYARDAALLGRAPGGLVLPMAGERQLLLPLGFRGAAVSSWELTPEGALAGQPRWIGKAGLPAELVLAESLDEGRLLGVTQAGALVTLQITPGARYSASLAPQPSPPALGGPVTALQLAEGAGGGRFALLASAAGDSLAVYRLGGALPQLVSQLQGPASGIGFAAPTALRSLQLGGDSFVLLAGGTSASLTVFRLSDAGGLEVRDHVIDSQETRFSAVSQLEVFTLGPRAYVLAAGAEGGLSLFALLPGGRLLYLQSLLPDPEAGQGLQAISALAVRPWGTGVEILVASARVPGVTRLLYQPPQGGRQTTGVGEVSGGPGEDLLWASARTTALVGGAGDDILLGAETGSGPLLMTGGAGADLFVPLPGPRRLVIGDFQPGLDHVDLSFLPGLRSFEQLQILPGPDGAELRYGGLWITLRSALGLPLTRATVLEGLVLPLTRLPLPGPERPPGLRLQAGQAAAELTGGPGDDQIRGGPGGDSLRGEAGADLIYGGGGADWIWGGPGEDILWGGAGDDRIWGGPGRNRIYGEAGNDTLFAGDEGDVIGGGPGDDSLQGGRGDDTIWAGTGNDRVGGGPGDDLIYGGTGRNTLWGGLGNDTIEGGSGPDLIYGGPGRNLLRGNLGADTIYAGPSGDEIWGGAGDDSLQGGAGADTIYGGEGNDRIGGGPGDDLIYGGPGQNRIWGGYGDDTLQAGPGRDVMNGGPGADVFVFASAAAIGIAASRDRIEDFTPGLDRIDLRGLETRFTGTRNQLGQAVAEGGVASFYHFAAGGLLIGDQNGDGKPDWVIELGLGLRLTAADFLL